MPTDPSMLHVATLLIGSVGMGYVLYGRKQAHPAALGCGMLLAVSLALMLLPFLLHRSLG